LHTAFFAYASSLTVCFCLFLFLFALVTLLS